METEFYKILESKLLDSGLSKRKFSEKYNINHAWFIEFMNPDKIFRPMQIKTMSVLNKELDIDIDVMHEYNKWVLESRKA